MTGRALVIRGDARKIPLPDNSVDLVLTSPPFYKLRSYTDAGQHYESQIGSENDPRDFIRELLACTQDWIRVLKPSGSIFVELGDTYAGTMNGLSNSLSASGNKGRGFVSPDQPTGKARAGGGLPPGFRSKSRMMMPQRYAIGCLDQLGLILRQEIIWHHVNETPESVGDRARTSHTVMYHFVKQPKYYAAVDVIREPRVSGATDRGGARRHVPRMDMHKTVRSVKFQLDQPHPLGRLPGSIWSIASAPLVVPEWVGVDHYAAFPPELCRRVILGFSPPGICTACGQGRFPVAEKSLREISRGERRQEGSKFNGEGYGRSRADQRTAASGSLAGKMGEDYVYGATEATITGWACACTPYTDHPERRKPTVTPDRMYMRGETDDQLREEAGVGGHREWPQRQNIRDYHWDRWVAAPTRPAVVLDPFGGTGTTALVASVYDRIGISVDMSADYCHLAAHWRTVDPGERARAMGVPKPPPVPPDQLPLFDLF